MRVPNRDFVGSSEFASTPMHWRVVPMRFRVPHSPMRFQVPHSPVHLRVPHSPVRLRVPHVRLRIR